MAGIVCTVSTRYGLMAFLENAEKEKGDTKRFQEYLLGRCENVKLWKMNFPQMNFGYTPKNNIVLEKEKKKKCTDFCDHAFEKIGSPLKVQKNLRKQFMVLHIRG